MPLFSADAFFDPPKAVDIEVYSFKEISETLSIEDAVFAYNTSVAHLKQVDTILVLYSTPYTFLDTYMDSSAEWLRPDELDSSSINVDVDRFEANHQSMVSEVQQLRN